MVSGAARTPPASIPGRGSAAPRNRVGNAGPAGGGFRGTAEPGGERRTGRGRVPPPTSHAGACPAVDTPGTSRELDDGSRERGMGGIHASRRVYRLETPTTTSRAGTCQQKRAPRADCTSHAGAWRDRVESVRRHLLPPWPSPWRWCRSPSGAAGREQRAAPGTRAEPTRRTQRRTQPRPADQAGTGEAGAAPLPGGSCRGQAPGQEPPGAAPRRRTMPPAARAQS